MHSSPVRPASVAALGAIAVCLFAAGCADDDLGPRPLYLVAVDGDGQEAQLGHAVLRDLVVRVEDEIGRPVADATVEWVPSATGAILAPVTPRSDSAGLARARWTLAPDLGLQQARARVGGETVTFDALATPPPPERWADVLDMEASASAVDGRLRGGVRIVNRWPGTVALATSSGCFHFPRLIDGEGRLVTDFGCCSCWAAGSVWRLGPDSTHHWGLHGSLEGVPPGSYELRLRFNVSRINGRSEELPPLTTPLTIPALTPTRSSPGAWR